MAYDAFVETSELKNNAAPSTPTPNTGVAQLLAYLAAAPLIVTALCIVSAGDRAGASAAHFMGLYGAALIIFFGGVRWGVAVMKPEGPTAPALLGAGVPLLIALPFLLPLPVFYKFPAIMIIVALLLLDDLQATRRGSGAPGWYLAVRLPLTVLIELAFLVALVGMG